MGAARRKLESGQFQEKLKVKPKVSKGDSPRVIPWLPITEKQRERFFSITKVGAWIGIGLLVALWIVVRVIGPAAGWWTPADT